MQEGGVGVGYFWFPIPRIAEGYELNQYKNRKFCKPQQIKMDQ